MADNSYFKNFLDSDQPWNPPQQDKSQPASANLSGFLDSDKPWEDFTKPAENASILEMGKDYAIDLGSGVVSFGESVVGIGDLLSGNLVGKGLYAAGFDPESTRNFLKSGYSEERKSEVEELQAASGFMDTVITAVQNPGMALGIALESTPHLLGSAAVVRAAATTMVARAGFVVGTPEAAAFLKTPAVLSKLAKIGAVSEGAMAAGSIQEQARQEGKGYLESAPYAAAGGAGTALIGRLASRIPGFGDLETTVATAGMNGGKKFGREGFIQTIKDMSKNTFQEGVLEEMPQSAQEQIFTNLALDRPWNEGVAEAAGTGLVAGAGMGAGVGLIQNTMNRNIEDSINRITDPNKSIDDALAEANNILDESIVEFTNGNTPPLEDDENSVYDPSEEIFNLETNIASYEEQLQAGLEQDSPQVQSQAQASLDSARRELEALKGVDFNNKEELTTSRLGDDIAPPKPGDQIPGIDLVNNALGLSLETPDQVANRTGNYEGGIDLGGPGLPQPAELTTSRLSDLPNGPAIEAPGLQIPGIDVVAPDSNLSLETDDQVANRTLNYDGGVDFTTGNLPDGSELSTEPVSRLGEFSDNGIDFEDNTVDRLASGVEDKIQNFESKFAPEEQAPSFDEDVKRIKFSGNTLELKDAIAALGGISVADAKAEGAMDLNQRQGFKWLGTKNGMAFDAMREALAQDGFDFATANDLVDALTESINDRQSFYAPAGYELQDLYEFKRQEEDQKQLFDDGKIALVEMEEVYEPESTQQERVMADRIVKAIESGSFSEDPSELEEYLATNDSDWAATWGVIEYETQNAQGNFEGQAIQSGNGQEERGPNTGEAQGASQEEIDAFENAFELDQPTEQSLQDDAATVAATQAEALTAAQRADADAQADDFVLAGSDSVVDQAEARGQSNMFDEQAPATEKEKARAKIEANRKPNELPRTIEQIKKEMADNEAAEVTVESMEAGSALSDEAGAIQIETIRTKLIAEEMPVIQDGSLYYTVSPSTRVAGSYQITTYNDSGALGDTTVETIDQIGSLASGIDLARVEILSEADAEKVMARVVSGESEFQSNKAAAVTEGADNQELNVDQRISQAESDGITLSDKDKSSIRSKMELAEKIRNKLNGTGDSYLDAVRDSFPLGMVGGSGRNNARLNSRREKAMDKSISQAGENVKQYNKADGYEKEALDMLQGKGTESSLADRSAKKETGKKEFARKAIEYKKGDVFGKNVISSVSKTRDGYPSKVKVVDETNEFSGDPTFELWRIMFDSKAEFHQYIDSVRAEDNSESAGLPATDASVSNTDDPATKQAKSSEREMAQGEFEADYTAISGLEIEYNGKRYPANSIGEAKDNWSEFKNSASAGASEIGAQTYIFKDGEPIAFISYNGKTWGKESKWFNPPQSLNTVTPEAIEPPAVTEPKSELAQATEAMQQVAAALTAQNESPVETSLMASVDENLAKMPEGELSIAEFKAAFEFVVENEEGIKAELSKLTKAQLLDRLDGYSAERNKNDKKARVVRSAFDDMVSDFMAPTAGESGMISFTIGVGGDAMASKKAKIDKVTQEDLDGYAKRVSTSRENRTAQQVEKEEGIENPETTEDYRNIMNKLAREAGVKTFKEGRALMPFEQRVEYDRLLAVESREKRNFDINAQKTRLLTSGQLVEGEIIETTHTKNGNDLFVVQLADRVPREDFLSLNSSAKTLGGRYSSFRGNGAVPGFTFTSRGSAEAFKSLAGGDSQQAEGVAQARRDAFVDDRSQSAVERLRDMAEKLDSRGNESLSQDRKANTARRAGMAASAEAKAQSSIALSKTMNRIADGIEAGEISFLDQVRAKTQVDMLESFIGVAKSDQAYSNKDLDYAQKEEIRNAPPTAETVEFANYPSYSAYRSDLAKLGRQLQELNGTKRLGDRLMKLSDDVTSQYTKFAKGNLSKVTNFVKKDGSIAAFSTKKGAQASIYTSGFDGKAVSIQVKRGEHVIVMSPSEAQKSGVWDGQEDTKVFLSQDFATELVEKVGRKSVSLPWQLDSAHEKRKRLSAMNIETPAEFRSALQEYVGLQEVAKAPDKIKELERKMVGRSNDDLDFFPTPAGIAEEMIETAGIEAGMTVLEPSAGMGHIADQMRQYDIEPDVIEMSGARRELLEAKGYNLVDRDFLESTEQYDRIIMNPPFSDRRDFEHVQHAYSLLKPGGRLVSIVGEGIFFGSDKKAKEFRSWFESVGGTDEKLAEGTFQDPSLPVTTGVNARMIVIEKDSGNSAPLESRLQKTGKGMTVASLNEAIAPVIETFSNEVAQQVVVVQSFSDLPTSITDYYDLDNPPSTRALYQGGKAYFIADAISSVREARTAVAHELIGHKGVLEYVGEQEWSDIKSTIDTQLGNNAEQATSIMAEVNRRYPGVSEETKYKEFLAVAAERRDLRGTVKDIIEKVKAMLRGYLKSMGFRGPFSESDIEIILQNSEKNLRGDQASAENTEMTEAASFGISFDKVSPEFFSQLYENVSSITQSKSSPEQLLAAIRKKGGVKEEEIQWTGIDKFLAGKKSVTKQEVLDYLSDNMVQVNFIESTGVARDDDGDSDIGMAVDMFIDGMANDSGSWANMLRSMDRGNLNISGLSFQDEDFASLEIGFSDTTLRQRKGILQTLIDDENFLDEISDISDNMNIDTEMPEYAGYTISGGTNYREILFRLPKNDGNFAPITELPAGYEVIEDSRNVNQKYGVTMIDGSSGRIIGTLQKTEAKAIEEALVIINLRDRRNAREEAEYEAPHYSGEKSQNLLASVRANDRVGPNGEKILFIEEIQSDWHQQGRKDGYVPSQADRNKMLEDINSARQEVYEVRSDAVAAISLKYDFLGFRTVGEAVSNIRNNDDWASRWDVQDEADISLINKYVKTKDDLAQLEDTLQQSRKKTPDAPFKGNAWVELSVKKILRLAAEGGYDQVAWTNGQQQADRYSLSKQVELIKYNAKKQNLQVWKKDPDSTDQYMEAEIDETVAPEDIEKHIGKEAAQKILSDDNQKDYDGYSVLKGDSLNIGGEGMKSFYDRTVPNVFSKVAKKLDKKASIGQVDGIEGDSVQQSLAITPEMRSSAMGGQPLFSAKESENKNKGKWKGKSFWIGAFDLIDGEILETHTFEEAESNDFHHTFYFRDKARNAIDEGRADVFTIEDGKVKAGWKSDRPSRKIENRISDQIKITNDILASQGTPESEFSAENRAIREEDKTLWSKAKSELKRQLTAGGLLPDSVFDSKISRDNELAVVEFDAAHYIGELERAVRDEYGVNATDLTETDQFSLSEGLSGRMPKNVKPKTKEALIKMRVHIDGISKEYMGILQEQTESLSGALDSGENILLNGFLEAGNVEAIDNTPAAKGQATRQRNEIMATAKDAAKEEWGGGKQMQASLGKVAIIAEKTSLMNTISANDGKYVHRSYKAFDDPSWAKKVPDKVLNNAREYLVQQIMAFDDLSEPEAITRARVVIEDILKEGTAYDNMESFISESKLGAKDLSVLKSRKQIAPEIRELLGEYRDPRVNYAKTVTKMGRLVFNQRFLEQVREAGMGVFLFNEDDRPPNTTQIAADSAEAYSPLNGLYTTREVKQSFKDALGKEQMADWYRYVIQVNGAVKFGKTVLSPTTAARNWQSAMFFTLANGHFDLTHMAKSVSGIKEYFNHAGDKEKLDYLRKLKHLGVVYDTPYAGEMMRLLEDSNVENLFGDSAAGMGVKKALGVAQKFYQYGDDFWKIIGFENEKQLLIKSGMSETDAEVESAERIRNTYPTYSMTGRAVNWLRRFPLAGTFVSFPAEIVRTSYHIMRYAAADMKDPARRSMGIKRLTGMAVASGLAYGLQAISKSMFDIDDEEEEAVRLQAAPWQKNSNFVFTGRDENGNLQYFDISFLDPYNYFKRPINAIMRDQPWEKEFASAASDLVSPFLGTDIMAGTIAQVAMNRKSSGGKIYNESDAPINQVSAMVDHIRKSAQPGIVSNLERTYKALKGEVSASGKKYDLGDEAWSWLGWRMSTLDPKTALLYRSYEFGDVKKDATQVLTRVLKDRNDIDDGDVEKAYELSLKIRKQGYDDMINLVNAAKKSGLTTGDVRRVLRNSGVSLSDVNALTSGRIPPWVPSTQQQTSAYRSARAVLGPEKAAEIRRRYSKARSLRRPISD